MGTATARSVPTARDVMPPPIGHDCSELYTSVRTVMMSVRERDDGDGGDQVTLPEWMSRMPPEFKVRKRRCVGPDVGPAFSRIPTWNARANLYILGQPYTLLAQGWTAHAGLGRHLVAAVVGGQLQGARRRDARARAAGDAAGAA